MVKPINKTQPEVSKKKTSKNSDKNSKLFPVVAMGGSAGAFDSFEKFFNNMPADSGMSFVIIMHLDPNYKSHLVDVIQRFTPMEVTEATDGLTVKPDKVYLIPPNKDMGIHNRKLLLLHPSKPKGIRQPIDYFFQSLASDQWNRSIAIIFSGMGSDGETGIRMIKENLGLTMIQDPETAEYNSMPLAAIATNLADYVLAPGEMPIKLIQFLNHPVMAGDEPDRVRAAIQNNNAIQKILMLLRSHTGNDFALYKKSTITRRIDRRVAFFQLRDYDHYVQYLKDNPIEIKVLFNELLIGVTKFFRDVQAFESLKSKLLRFIKSKHDKDPIRVWVTGCSTGEEAYSVAMLLIECLDILKGKDLPEVQLYATDIDEESLEIARAGIYYGNIVADVSPERIDRFFVKRDEKFAVKKELRDMVVFAQHNVIKDAPFIRLDLLCCRNMLIYFTTELQKNIIPVFYYALKQKGIMFMGPAETIGGFTDMFSAIDPKWKLFERKEGNVTMSKLIDFPFQVTKKLSMTNKTARTIPAVGERSMMDIFHKVLIDNFTPSSVLVNEKGDILYSNGRTGRYMELPSGEAVMNIHKMARAELKYVIDNSIQQAISKGDLIQTERIKLKEEKQIRMVTLKAIALKEEGLQGLVLLVFEDNGLLKKNKGRQAADHTLHENPEAEQLEKELIYTKFRLNKTIEQMETSLEELKSSNEELQSTNEELQSTNEESLTTKEEMQSLNEELMTVNMQYQAKAEELFSLNNDMKNLLDSTEIGTIFLDNDLNILRYTPQVKKLFNLIPTDVGRPIMHVVSNFEKEFNEQDISGVIDTLKIKELDISTKTREWYRVRIMPYRTLDNFISGAVLTFTLITDYKHMQSQLSVLKNYTDSIIDNNSDPVVHLNGDLKVVSVNQAFLKFFKLEDKDILGRSLGEFLNKQWKTETPGQMLQQCLDTSKSITVPISIVNNSNKTFTLNIQPFTEETDSTPLIVVTINEKT